MTDAKPAADDAVAQGWIEAASALHRALRHHAADPTRPMALSPAQRELVRLVRHQPGIRVREAANELHLAPNAVSTLVTTLRDGGWLQRVVDVEDGRAVRLHLTAASQRRVAAWRDRRQSVLVAALGRLNATDQNELAQALPALQRLVAALEETE